MDYFRDLPQFLQDCFRHYLWLFFVIIVGGIEILDMFFPGFHNWIDTKFPRPKRWKLFVIIAMIVFPWFSYWAYHDAKVETRSIQRELAECKAQRTRKLAFVNVPQAPPHFAPDIPNTIHRRLIEVGVTNLSDTVVRGVTVKHISTVETETEEPYFMNEILQPRNRPSETSSVSINPGDTELFIFGEEVIRKDLTRYIQFPMKGMTLEPGRGPVKSDFPIVYLIGLRMSGANIAEREALFRLTVLENGFRFILVEEDP
jgi:hypothetical protein